MTDRLNKLRRDALERERTLLSERRALLEEKIESFIGEVDRAREAMQERNLGTFLQVRYPRGDDISITLAQLRDTRMRLLDIIARDLER